jgi:type II secretory pathway pseudopilin PulG
MLPLMAQEEIYISKLFLLQQQQQQQQQQQITMNLINKQQQQQQQQQQMPSNVLPHWTDTFPTTSTGTIVIKLFEA